jgi:multiple sugar transport system permease protein
MSGGGPGYSSNTLAVFAFVKARGSLDFGYGSTISIFLTLMLLVVMFVYIKELKKQGDKL